MIQLPSGLVLPPGVTPIPCIDLSSNNWGPVGIDFPTLAQFMTAIHPEAICAVKVSEGTDYVNEDLHAQRWGAHAAGFRNVLLYHFGRPSQNSGHAEFAFFSAAVGKDGAVVRGEGGMLDMEDPNVSPTADLNAYAHDYLDNAYQTMGFRYFHYTSEGYALAHNLANDATLALNPLWDAAWQSQPPTPFGAYKRIIMWQYTDKATVPGVSGPVDLSWFFGTVDELHSYLLGYQPSPLTGMPVNTAAPDVPVAINSQSSTDAEAIALKIAADSGALAAQLAGSQQQAAQTIQADADRLALVLKEG